MRPVISVSLNGRAYQLEDDAHAALANYLDITGRTCGIHSTRCSRTHNPPGTSWYWRGKL